LNEKASILMLQREITQEINILAAQFAQENSKIYFAIFLNKKNLDTLVVLDYGGRDEVINEELIKNLDFMSPNEVLFLF
jgi:hypothetical protein